MNGINRLGTYSCSFRSRRDPAEYTKILVTFVLTAYAMIADEQLDAVEGYKEFIHHEPVQTEPVAE